MADSQGIDPVSSPASTGGAGTFFEQHVDAYWLALLLVRGIPPILHDCVVEEVHLQVEHLGWHTDDFLIIGENGSGERRQLAGQVKRTFTVSAADDECKKAVQDFCNDFKNPERFSPDKDRFALITLRGTNTLLEHFSALLECARASRDGAEFERRLGTPGFISRKAVQYCNEVRKIIGEMEGKRVSAAEIWPLLRVLHVLSLDLNTETRQTETQIRTLLAYTTSEHDKLAAAEATWNALLREVAEGMPQARSFQYDDLPVTLRQRHSPIGGNEQRALRALSDHSALILDSIHSTIGEDLHLSRTELVQQTIENLESTQVVLISGPAGSGKSVIAKDVINILTDDHFAFSFRAEEFAYAHLDGALQSNQIPANGIMLGAILAGQARKILLVESLERLLERSTRDAFTDLLSLVARDNSWRLVLTCRDYSTDLVRAAFLESAGLGHSVLKIPRLSDEELEEVKAVHPTLARPLGNAALRQLLRNPYFLDKALQIDWSAEHPLPQSEWELRELFWREIVRADHRGAGAMPRRRGDTFVQIALRRAQRLSLYADCGDLDPEVVGALRNDSLIVSHPQSDVLIAPAHDILEDWAILHWIEEQYVRHEGAVRDFATAIDTYPAVRRAYRKWVTELVERDHDRADELFQAAVGDSGLPGHYRDDTLVSLLRSPSSVEFLEKHTSELFANNKQLLRRVIHLLRVACVTAPNWLGTLAPPASFFNVPDGPAWACVLRVVRTQLDSFAQEDCSLLLGLIEDWARGVTWKDPYPGGAKCAAEIAHWLLGHFQGYHWKDERRTLQVIAKIPKAAPERFVDLLQGSPNHDKRDHLSEKLREIIFEGLEGMPAARDMPELTVSVARDYLLCSEADLQREWGYSRSLELETLFGIKEHRSFGFFPASAYRGPFLPLLRFDPHQGLDFVIDVFNHSAEWYAHPRVHSDIEPPFEITMTFPEGTTLKQWCNARLWNLYRGTSVGPYVLQSLLMALERWLLEFAETRPDELDQLLLSILKRSHSAALTAVVAGVATAHPHASGETLLALLRSRECILLDRQRLVNESQAPSSIAGFLPQLNASNKVYEAERKEADALPHRRWDLEHAILNLQLGPLAPQVHKILDELRAEMPPVEEQDENDRIWRLALHRMDLRQYSVVADKVEGSVPSGDPTSSEEVGRQYIRLDLREPEPDLKEMADQSAAQMQSMNARIGLLMWGLNVFGHEEDAVYDPARWRQKLLEARDLGAKNGGDEEHDLGQGGPGVVAAVCVRDHWDEISEDERDWCVDVVCSEIEREADQWNHLARVQRNSMSADRPCAWVLPLLLGKALNDTQTNRVRQALVIALTHAIDEVRWYAALGIGKHLWAIDRDLSLRCVNALSMEATLVQEAVDAERSRPYAQRRKLDEIQAEAAAFIRQRFFKSGGIADDAYTTMDLTKWFGAEANKHILAILA
ncbi:MAG: ATP-binding protein, partial [Chloroflexota bacterium]